MWRAIPFVIAMILITSAASAQQPCTSDENQVVGVPRYEPLDVYGDAVRVLYRHLLGREADFGGMKGAADYAVEHGLPALIPYFLNSPEYMERFGEHRVPGPGEGRAAYCAQR